MEPLHKSFFKQETTQVAQNLLGCYLVRTLKGKTLIAQIVETEAYLGLKDPACHSFKGLLSQRTKSMYRPSGFSYVYLIYGMYYCFNVVTGGVKQPEAVLIRAIKPLQGLQQMAKNRYLKLRQKNFVKLEQKKLQQITKNPSPELLKNIEKNKKALTKLGSGPGKLCQALNITKSLNEKKLYQKGEIYIAKGKAFKSIEADSRVGLDPTKDSSYWFLRFYVKNNPFVSLNTNQVG